MILTNLIMTHNNVIVLSIKCPQRVRDKIVEHTYMS